MSLPKTQIRIEKWGASKDVNGNMKEAVQNIYNLWAEIVQSSGVRTDSQGQTRLNKTRTFKIRFRPDWQIDSTWKLVYLKKRYSITDIERIQEKRFNWLINGEG